jgi:hypothetical protein
MKDNRDAISGNPNVQFNFIHSSTLGHPKRGGTVFRSQGHGSAMAHDHEVMHQLPDGLTCGIGWTSLWLQSGKHLVVGHSQNLRKQDQQLV